MTCDTTRAYLGGVACSPPTASAFAAPGERFHFWTRTDTGLLRSTGGQSSPGRGRALNCMGIHGKGGALNHPTPLSHCPVYCITWPLWRLLALHQRLQRLPQLENAFVCGPAPTQLFGPAEEGDLARSEMATGDGPAVDSGLWRSMGG